MTKSLITSTSTRLFRSTSGAGRLIALIALAGIGAFGCAAGPIGEEGLDDEGQGVDLGSEVASLGAPLKVGGSGPRLGFKCTNGVCTCDKGIENDCEDMSGVCRDEDIDDLIKCIDGWLTTDCTCHLAKSVPPATQIVRPSSVGTFQLAR